MMKPRVVVIGAGINGLVAANYLQRNGFNVVLLEKETRTGGACAHDRITLAGKEYTYPNGASVFGFMQDFVYEQTGLSKRLSVYAPQHPAIVYSEKNHAPCRMFGGVEQLRAEVKTKWGEVGDVAGFYADLKTVRTFLVDGYRKARVPNLRQAEQTLGTDLTARWISGSARALLDHYFSSQKMKVFCALDVVESGPVSIDSPYSAFSIPLMASGTVFGGEWGFVRGGIWQIAEQLTQANKEIGIEVITDARVLSVSTQRNEVQYAANGQQLKVNADMIVFATDPLSAARLLGEEKLCETTKSKNVLGSSGKALLFFNRPVRWKNVEPSRDPASSDFDLAFRFLLNVETLDQLEANTQAVIQSEQHYVPGFAEIYCEGAANRRFDNQIEHDMLAIFFKNLSLDKKGSELPEVRASIESQILALIENPEDLAGSILFTPKDLQGRFGFPGGNLDHVELCDGQTYFSRTYSSDPEASFYQFGSSPNVFYCAAGAYPCGSIAGTPGFMCAQQVTASALLQTL